METMCSSKTSVDFQQTTQHYIPGDNTLHGNEALGSINGGEFLDQLSDYQLLNDSAQLS
jgi:hypothetical protein